MSITQFILVGGFLGAGKTTLIARLATHYVAEGKRVAIVTNDQAADLVDTHTLRGQGFDVGEVAGACFCCSFDNLLETALQFGNGAAPDIILAEPVGSCTDLVATVILPLEQLYGQSFTPSPFGVLLKPSHGRRILGLTGQGGRGFSPQAEYIFRKQLEEADYLMIGRADELTAEEIESLREALQRLAPGVPVLAVSPKTSVGIEQVLRQLDTAISAPRRVLQIDYDVYAEGEAELGWVNLTAELVNDSPTDLDGLTSGIARRCGELLAGHDAEVAHLKCIAMANGLQSVANLVHSAGNVDHALRAGRDAIGPVRVVVNARVAVDPQVLEAVCRKAVDSVAAAIQASVSDVGAHALRPGRPVPTHRVTI